MYYRVVIKDFDKNEVIKAFKWLPSERAAERIDDGVNINLNHDQYYTLIEKVEHPIEE